MQRTVADLKPVGVNFKARLAVSQQRIDGGQICCRAAFELNECSHVRNSRRPAK